MGLGKPRTKFGKWTDKKKLSQQDIIRICKIDKNTTSKVCNDLSHNPNQSTKGRIIMGLRNEGYNVYEDDFWT